MSSIYNVTIHSEINEFPVEKRFDANIKISELKKKLELITGANHTSMKITLSIGEKEVGELDKDDESLSYYVGDLSGQDVSSLKLVVKDDQSANPLEGDVPKYTISEDKYLERGNNARNFIKQVREKLTN